MPNRWFTSVGFAVLSATLLILGTPSIARADDLTCHSPGPIWDTFEPYPAMVWELEWHTPWGNKPTEIFVSWGDGSYSWWPDRPEGDGNQEFVHYYPGPGEYHGQATFTDTWSNTCMVEMTWVVP